MGRHDELLTFIGEIADQFGAFRVVAIDPQDGTRLPINEVIAHDSDQEICLVSNAKADGVNLVLGFSELQTQLALHPDYSLNVSKWFEIGAEYTGRFDFPLKSIEVDERERTIQLIY